MHFQRYWKVLRRGWWYCSRLIMRSVTGRKETRCCSSLRVHLDICTMLFDPWLRKTDLFLQFVNMLQKLVEAEKVMSIFPNQTFSDTRLIVQSKFLFFDQLRSTFNWLKVSKQFLLSLNRCCFTVLLGEGINIDGVYLECDIIFGQKRFIRLFKFCSFRSLELRMRD